MLFRAKIHNLEYDNCIGSVYTVVLLGGNLATALYSDMKVPHDISRILLRSQSLEFIEIISSLSSELNLWFLNQMSGMTESDNTEVHSNNARARRAQFAAMSSRAIYWDKQSKIFNIKL